MTGLSYPTTDLNGLIDTIATGFESLLAELQAQRDSQDELRRQVRRLTNEYQRLLAASSDRLSSSTDPSPAEVPDCISEIPKAAKDIETIPAISLAKQALQTIRMSHQPMPEAKLRKCPVTHKTTDAEDFEHDFTTQGKAGSLECPFAKLAQNADPLLQSANGHIDPIAAEFHQDQVSVASAGAAGQCPIRFLDKHSPEEIAKYFENHKHEIPRSHEICVKRYQQNEQGIRELDAKYGSLVNMIQGLGVKHKQFLPEPEKPAKQEDSSTGVVEKWAEDISHKSVPMSDRSEHEGDEPRLSHFEKPLREIRVGESPSRPWGISVPVENEIAPSALESEKLRIRRQNNADGPPLVPGNTTAHPLNTTHPPVPSGAEGGEKAGNFSAQKDETRDQRPQIIFNGPVFFGYSAEQAAALLHSLSLGSQRPA